MQNAKIEYSVEKQKELQQNIDDITPIVEENKVATEILQNRIESLKGQNTKYDSERHTLTLASHSYNNEIASLATLGNQRRVNLKEVNLLGELLLLDYLVHFLNS